MFDRCTRNEASRGRKLLIVDGNNNHFNMAFIDYANRHRILLVILPPHSTHRLQFLDIALFSPLANYYTQKLDRLIFEGQGLSRMIKRQFWKLFRRAWERAFTDENIRSGFKTASNSPPKTFAEVVSGNPPQTANHSPETSPAVASGLDVQPVSHLSPKTFAEVASGISPSDHSIPKTFGEAKSIPSKLSGENSSSTNPRPTTHSSPEASPSVVSSPHSMKRYSTMHTSCGP
jgi:hypothetical protein